MRIAVVVSTLGLVDLQPLLASLRNQSVEPSEVVIVDQGQTNRVATEVAKARHELPIRRITSERGASRGRNRGAEALYRSDAIFFTDDDCQLDPYALEVAARQLGEGASIVTGRLQSNLGTRGQRIATRTTTITRKNVWTLGIEATTAVKRTAFEALRGFDESLGTGASTLWQSGEGTDLLLRALDQGFTLVHDPNVQVVEEATPVSADQTLQKARRYARGTGRVYRLHYGALSSMLACMKPLARVPVALVRGNLFTATLALNVTIGRITGYQAKK